MRVPAAPFVPAAMAALLVVPAVYAVLRVGDVLFHDEPDPATAVWSAHIAMFSRLAVAAYAAGMVAPLAYWAARRDLARTMRVLCALVPVVAAVIAVQGLFCP